MQARLLTCIVVASCRFNFENFDVPPGGGGDGSIDGTGSGFTLTVVLDGDGTGVVTSQPPGIVCPPTCAAAFPVGDIVLAATPTSPSTFGGWGQRGCIGAGPCNVTITEDVSLTARFNGARNFIFVSSRSDAPGALGGITGADSTCASLAAQVGFSGTYIALLSTSTATLTQRLGSARGWVRPDGMPVADTVADLIGGQHFYPPNVDETGVRIPDVSFAVTGTTSMGTTGSTCTDYTDVNNPTNATSSAIHHGSAEFIGSGSIGCSATTARLYCAGTSFTTPVTVLPHEEKVAFATAFNVTGGLAGADATCMTAAASAGLGGTFIALLGIAGVPASSRIASATHGWVRPDGVPVAGSRLDFENGRLFAPISLEANGLVANYGFYTGSVWTGASGFTAIPVAGDTCADWTSTSANGREGFISADYRFFNASGGGSCQVGPYIYCVQM